MVCWRMIDIDPPLRVKGRSAREPAVAVVREITLEDLGLLATEKGSKPPAIKQIRDVHHSLARCLALGMKPAEASLVTGYSISRISILQSDPSFKELLEFYSDATRAKNAESLADFSGRMLQTAKLAQEELTERLVDKPESFDNDELRKLMETAADRAGYAPKSGKSVTVNISLAQRLEAGRKRVEELDRDGTLLIEGAVLPPSEEPVP